MNRIVIGVLSLLALGVAASAQTPQLVRQCIGTAGNCVPVSASNPMPIDGTISASLAGFEPSAAGSRGTPLTVTTADSTGTLPTGAVVIVSNVGTTNPMYCNVRGVAATVADQLITANGGWFAFTIPSGITTLRCIATGGSTTANSLGGTGLPTGTGGGSGGGGGAATIADGADVTQGAIADASVAAGATGSISAKLRRISQDIDSVKTNTSAAIPAQTTNAVNIGAVMNAGSTYETVAASQTGQILGGAGAIGDYLSHCVIYPTTTTPGVVTVFDDASAAGTNVIAFPGGASSVSNLVPIPIPVGAVSVAGEWRVTTGANVVVTCYGKFT